MKKTFKASPKTIKAAVELDDYDFDLDERWNFEFPEEEFELYVYNDYVKCTLVAAKVVDPDEIEYTIAIESPEGFWQYEKWLLGEIEEYMSEWTDGSDYSFFAFVEKGTPEGFYGAENMYVYTATVNVYAVAVDWTVDWTERLNDIYEN